MKKLLREQMKKIKGGEDMAILPIDGGGTQGSGDSCRTSSPNPPNKTCKAGLTCKDNKNETGGTCV